MSMIERNGSPRYSIVLVAELTILGTETTLNRRTSDIGRAGCHLDSPRPFPAGTRFVVKLLRGKEIFEARAAVVYVSQYLGMNIAFETSILTGQMETLEPFISAAAHESAELPRSRDPEFHTEESSVGGHFLESRK
jgi:PilZ domain